MLVLTARNCEQIVLTYDDGTRAELRVYQEGNKIKVGITAPADVVVTREKLEDDQR